MIAQFRRRRDVLMQELGRLPVSPLRKAQGVLSNDPPAVQSSERFCEWLLGDFSDRGGP